MLEHYMTLKVLFGISVCVSFVFFIHISKPVTLLKNKLKVATSILLIFP